MRQEMDEASSDSPTPLARFDVIILAAGISRRFPDGNKLIAPYRGRPLMDHILQTIDRLDVGRRIIVTGARYRGDTLAVLKDHQGWEEVLNVRSEDGIGSSIAAGAARLSTSEAVFICPADMPDILPQDFCTIARLWNGAHSICRPMFGGHPGHPVLFGHGYYDQLRSLKGSKGASGLVRTFGCSSIEVDSMRVVRDFDSPWHFP